ncbi:MAG TPA: carboxypeptidase-like regulatory domain-containing protein, partial [Bacteroidia bacterium]|nr:carboxypeptidase-like regulatory domain-containing protein [Bacteroidia bacterium]
MKIYLKIIFFALLIGFKSLAQVAPNWTLKFSSVVEKDGKGLGGANVTLYEGSKKVSQTVTGSGGNFIVDIPANSEFVLVISMDGSYTKKFLINTTGVPEGMTKDNFKPELKLEGVTLSKPLYSIDYSALNQYLMKASYSSSKKKFEDDPVYTNQMLGELAKIREAERVLFDKYTAANKAGDEALKKLDCEKAKENYTKANSLLPDEQYPKDQLTKADKCAADKAEQKKKEEAAKLAAEKAAADKLVADKAAADKIAAEKAAADKAAAEKAAADKIAAEKAAADKAAADKAAADKIAAEKAAA